MTSLIERIRRGEAAISRAKAEGREVREWEEHLEKLKRDAQPDYTDDPVLTHEQWYLPFRDFHHGVIRETPDFSYCELREQHPELYRQVKAKEKEIDAIGPARLSEVLIIMREWRRLILRAEFDRRDARIRL